MTEFESAVQDAQREIDRSQFVIQMRIKLAHIELLSDCIRESAEKEQLPPAWVATMTDTIFRDVKICQANLEQIK